MSKQMIKRKDGSYSQRGLWDNIRANKGSGKKPTKAMLKQEKKIKSKYGLGGEMDNNPVQYPVLQSAASSMQNQASNSLGAPVNMPQEEQPQSAFKKGGIKNKKSEIMKTMYKKAGKAPKKMKESFLEESKEIHFGNPPKGKKKFRMGGDPTDPPAGTATSTTATEPEKPVAEKKEEKKEPGFYDLAMQVAQTKPKAALRQAKNLEKKKLQTEEDIKVAEATKTRKGANFGAGAAGLGSAATGLGNLVNSFKPGVTVKTEERTGGKRSYMGGGKSMKPGGGGRFAAMVGELKGKGKSAEQAAGIAASAGRKKYGKSKFQAMAAAGKARMGGKKC